MPITLFSCKISELSYRRKNTTVFEIFLSVLGTRVSLWSYTTNQYKYAHSTSTALGSILRETMSKFHINQIKVLGLILAIMAQGDVVSFCPMWGVFQSATVPSRSWASNMSIASIYTRCAKKDKKEHDTYILKSQHIIPEKSKPCQNIFYASLDAVGHSNLPRWSYANQ